MEKYYNGLYEAEDGATLLIEGRGQTMIYTAKSGKGHKLPYKTRTKVIASFKYECFSTDGDRFLGTRGSCYQTGTVRYNKKKFTHEWVS